MVVGIPGRQAGRSQSQFEALFGGPGNWPIKWDPVQVQSPRWSWRSWNIKKVPWKYRYSRRHPVPMVCATTDFGRQDRAGMLDDDTSIMFAIRLEESKGIKKHQGINGHWFWWGAAKYVAVGPRCTVLFKEGRSCIRTDAFVAEYCLIGDAGVAKTAIAEGVAQILVIGKVSRPTSGYRLVSLDSPRSWRYQVPGRIRRAVAGCRGGPEHHDDSFLDEIQVGRCGRRRHGRNQSVETSVIAVK
jgi:hypothetical protein